jgi:hypothetical protein
LQESGWIELQQKVTDARNWEDEVRGWRVPELLEMKEKI